MGSCWSRTVEEPEYEMENVRIGGSMLLRIGKEKLLTLALNDSEVYEMCKKNATLRQNCILACVRKFHTEKFFYEEVQNRTAAYMLLMDTFMLIQDTIDRQEAGNENGEPRVRYLAITEQDCQDREGDAAENGEEEE